MSAQQVWAAVECKQDFVNTQWLVNIWVLSGDSATGCPTRLGSAVVPLGILGAWQCRWTPTMSIWTVRFWALGVGLTAVTPHFGRSVTSLRAQNVDSLRHSVWALNDTMECPKDSG